MSIEPKRRPKELQGKTYRVVTGCGNLYVTINRDNGNPFEIFAHLGKTGQCGAAQIESICRLSSICLRSGIGPESIIKQLENIRCPFPIWSEGVQILSCADAIANALQEEVSKGGGA